MRGNCMNILFLTMSNITSINKGGIYPDLLNKFVKNNHYVYIVAPNKSKTQLVEQTENCSILSIDIGNLYSANLIKKGIATLLVPSSYKKEVRKYFKNIKFDLILYSTPPITLYGAIKYFKKRDDAKTFLLLKDIFPQNAIDICILKKSGIKGLIYRYFRKKEKKLYAISDRIGCMSQANVDYVSNNNPEVDKLKLTIVPNSIEPIDVSLTKEERFAMREKYDIPQDRTVFVYGGNLGKPQGIQFIIECLRSQKHTEKAFFLLVGDGTEYSVLEHYVETEKPKNVRLMKRLPKEDYDRMLAACDVGMLFLDYRFSIPNYPSRLLSYMQAGIPVLSCTDKNTDVGDDIEKGGFGWKCESNDVDSFVKSVTVAIQTDRVAMGQRGRQILIERFNVNDGYKTIMSAVRE